MSRLETKKKSEKLKLKFMFFMILRRNPNLQMKPRNKKNIVMIFSAEVEYQFLICFR